MGEESEQTQISEFKSLLEELRRQILDAQIHFDIWEKLWPTGENVGVINSYKGFFIPTRNAHLDRFFIRVSNAVDADPRSPSFYRVLRMLTTKGDLAPRIDVRSLRNRLKKLKDLLRRIKQYRNKRAAHWDTDAIGLDAVHVGESRSLLDELESIYNEINSAHNGTVWSFTIPEYRDTDRILNRLR